MSSNVAGSADGDGAADAAAHMRAMHNAAMRATGAAGAAAAHARRLGEAVESYAAAAREARNEWEQAAPSASRAASTGAGYADFEARFDRALAAERAARAIYEGRVEPAWRRCADAAVDAKLAVDEATGAAGR